MLLLVPFVELDSGSPGYLVADANQRVGRFWRLRHITSSWNDADQSSASERREAVSTKSSCHERSNTRHYFESHVLQSTRNAVEPFQSCLSGPGPGR